MARLFYDLETSGISTRHQILTACFIVCNDEYEIDNIFNFRVALNPLEIPDESAIFVNAVDITQHMLHHTNRFPDLITEEEFANKLHNLLSFYLEQNLSPLIGYNSNKFDIKHLRKVLIKWGYNPYYSYNRFPMVDLYNHVKFLKLSRPSEFDGIENLKLGTVYKQLVKKDTGILHEAEADVKYCVEIASFLREHYDWDIAKENHRVNNLFGMMLIPGDNVILANPHTEVPVFEKYIVHESNDSNILLEKVDLEKDDKRFLVINKNDFGIGKHIGHKDISVPWTIDQYYKSFENEGTTKFVEDFIYHIGFKDFKELANIRDNPDSYEIGPTFSHLGEMMNSQTFTRLRLIKHTDYGLAVDELSDGEQWYLISYFETYGLGDEEEKCEGKENADKVQLLKEYKAAYKELFSSLT